MQTRARWTLPALIGVAMLAAALGAYGAASLHSRRTRPFELSARPGRRWLTPGGTARYRIVIHRHRFAGRVRVRVRGAVARARTRLAFARHSRSKLVLIVRTGRKTPPGSYRLRVTGSYGHLSAALRLALRVTAPREAGFAASGDAMRSLEPGVLEPLDVTLENPNPRAIRITGLTVGVKALSAPRASDLHPCSLLDFAVWQFAGGYPLTVPASSKRTLSSLGVPSSLWPQVAILNRRVNQDGCQGATVTLSYSGNASTS